VQSRRSRCRSPPARPPAEPASVKPPEPAAVKPAEPWRGKGLTDDGIRQAVILRAKAYQRPTCEADPKTLYVMAATRYAEVLMRSAGCHQFPRCAMGLGAFERVWELNRSAADQPAAAAMAAVPAPGQAGSPRVAHVRP
jgi:hypothetical protein